MLEAVRRVVFEERPHAGIELVFTPKEEIGLLGATELDVSQLRARAGFVYDQAAPIGEVVVGAPSAQELVLRFHGRPAHAGMYPEEGRSAVLAAARAIVDMPLGRIDDHHLRQRWAHRRRLGAEHRPRVVRAPGGGPARTTSRG